MQESVNNKTPSDASLKMYRRDIYPTAQVVPGIGIESVPILTEVFGRVPKTSVGYSLKKNTVYFGTYPTEYILAINCSQI